MLIVSVLALGLIGTGMLLLVPILMRLFRRCSADEISAEWVANFSPSTYHTMHGLLAREDFQFLARQPGFDLSLYRKLRRERMHIFRQYLNCLINDFNRLHAYARRSISESQNDRSEFVVPLALLKVRFTISVVKAELSYYSCLLGIGSLASRAVVMQLEELSSQLVSMSLASNCQSGA